MTTYPEHLIRGSLPKTLVKVLGIDVVCARAKIHETRNQEPRNAACPNCGSRLGIWIPTTRIIRCKKCKTAFPGPRRFG